MPPIEQLLRAELKRVTDQVKPDSSVRSASPPAGMAGACACSRSPPAPPW